TEECACVISQHVPQHVGDNVRVFDWIEQLALHLVAGIYVRGLDPGAVGFVPRPVRDRALHAAVADTSTATAETKVEADLFTDPATGAGEPVLSPMRVLTFRATVPGRRARTVEHVLGNETTGPAHTPCTVRGHSVTILIQVAAHRSLELVGRHCVQKYSVSVSRG